MIINQTKLIDLKPVEPFLEEKVRGDGITSYGLTEGGYDIRIKQEVTFTKDSPKFTLASTIEKFTMPSNLLGIVHDKSTWARKGLSVFNTVVEPGWCGYLTLELVYHGTEPLTIPAGSGIAQVIFHEIAEEIAYDGKYQNQADKPVEAIAG